MDTPPETDQNIYASLPLASNSIRLLQINNSRPEDKTKGNSSIPISLNLKVFPFSGTSPVPLHSARPSDVAALPPYRCLSYVWGKKEHHSIFVNGKLMPVTKNLLRFLHRLRAGTNSPDGWVWIDAICIDQSNDAERASQVAMMGAIYARAQSVMVWLGQEEDREGDATDQVPDSKKECGVEDGVALVRLLAERMANWGGDPWTKEFGQFAFDDQRMHELLDFPHLQYKSWRALGALLDRKWFRRSWIVQEASLAKKMVVIVGNAILKWEEIVQTCVFLQASGWAFGLMYLVDPTETRMPYGLQVLMWASLQYVCRLEAVPAALGRNFKLPALLSPLSVAPDDKTASERVYDLLARLLVCTRPFEATDARDKIWAPLGMVRQIYCLTDFDLPSTSYSVTAPSIYEEVTARILESSSDLFILSQTTRPPSTRTLPSWVPDYSQTSTHALTDRPGLEYNALPGVSKTCTVDRRTRSISLQGHRMDTIAPLASPNLNDMFNRKDFLPLLDFCINHMDLYGVHRAEVLWRTLIGDYDGTSFPASQSTGTCFKTLLAAHIAIAHHGNELNNALPPVDSSVWDKYSSFDTLRALCTPSASPTSSPDADNDDIPIPSTTSLASTAEHWRAIMTGSLDLREARTLIAPLQVYALAAAYVYPNRAVMVTQKGVVGMAPDWARAGDEIWFLAGGRVPFVLRPGEGGVWEMVGECYMHEYMQGEVLKQEGVGFEEVVIR